MRFIIFSGHSNFRSTCESPSLDTVSKPYAEVYEYSIEWHSLGLDKEKIYSLFFFHYDSPTPSLVGPELSAG